MPRAKRDRADVLIEQLTYRKRMDPAAAAVLGRELITLLTILPEDVDTMLVCAPELEVRYPEVALDMYEAIVRSEPLTLATVMGLTEYLRICRDRKDPVRAGRLLPRAITLELECPYRRFHEELDALRHDPVFASLFGD